MSSVRPENKSTLRLHCDFFDRDSDGWLSLTDTFTGFLALGYGYFISFLAMVIIHMALAYPSQSRFIPPLDKFWMINLDNIERCRHGSDTRIYNSKGDFDKTKYEKMWGELDPDNTGALGMTQIVKLIIKNRNIYDVAGILAAIAEWTLLFLIAADPKKRWTISKEDVMAQYDGTLFYNIEKRIKGQRR